MNHGMKCLTALALLSPTLAMGQYFEGFYGSFNVGIIQTEAKITHDIDIQFPMGDAGSINILADTGNPAKHTDISPFGGLSLGYSQMVNPCFLLGAELRGSVQDLEMNHDQHLRAPIANARLDFEVKTELDQQYALLFKVGGLLGKQTQLYGLVGPQYGLFRFNSSGNFFIAPPGSGNVTGNLKGDRSTHKWGYLVGIGMEYAFNCNVSLGLEYNFVNFGSLNVPTHIEGVLEGSGGAVVGYNNGLHLNTNSMMLRFNYYFGS